ncbi:MAG: hypothetical protein U0457_07150 [Candidatus Sericytochromatia bacterium]
MSNNPEYKKIKFEDLELDKENPRLPKSMSKISEDDIINFFLTDTSLLELMLAIGKNDFFEGEQLLVVPSSNNKYIVVEGNRRLASVKLLNNPNIATIYTNKIGLIIQESTYFPKEIPCLVFNNKNEILKYLGYRHITGVKPWKLLEKARYVTNLKKSFYNETSIIDSSREIAKMIGSRKDYVKRLLVGYEIYENIENNGFYNIKELDDTTFHFNYIADSLSRENIEAFLGVDLNKEKPLENINYVNLKNLINWFFNKDLPNKIIADSESLTALNKVLANDKALESFKKGENLFKSLELTEEINHQFKKSVEESLKLLETADNLSNKVNEFYSELENDLKEINKIIKKIRTLKQDIESEKFDD